MRCPFDADPEAVVVPRLWPDSTIVILATGPSLTHDDVEYCRGKAPVIAINDAHTLAPWADVLYSSDSRWWEFYKGVPAFRGLKYGIKPLQAKSEWGVSVLHNTGDKGLDIDPRALRTGRNSGAAAINLALHLGASRVLLLGYDMGRSKGRSHFFGEHPTRLRSRSPYGSFISFFDRMVAPLKDAGVSVVNCSRQTAIECFPRMPLREALL